MKSRRMFVVTFAVVLALALVLLLQHLPFGAGMLQQFAPFLLPSSQLARNLKSTNTDLVRESLGILAERRDPVAAERAIELLKSSDDYVWLNAADYVGGLGRQESVPYLIKGLRHTAWRSDGGRIADLQRLTGQPLGTNFVAWSNWWTQAHPTNSFDFESRLGPLPRR